MEQDLNNFENLFTWPMDTHSPSQSADANTTHICMARCEEAFVCESLQSAVHQAFSIKYKEIAQFFLWFFYVVSDVENIMSKGVFSDKAAFYRLVKWIVQNCRIWVLQNPRAFIGLERDSPKINVSFVFLELKL